MFLFGCDGVCGSGKVADNCGTCDFDTTNDCTADCSGEYGGDKVADICGVCNGDGTSCYGCTDATACNFDATATIFDNSCIYVSDCAGVACGDAALDECGVCDSNTSNDCQDCSDYFTTFNISTLQASYLFYDVTINGIAVDSDDWVVAFNGSVCVGARQWNTTFCSSGVCDVAVMGDNGSINTDGYMQTDDIPTFKIYDVSQNVIYNTTGVDSAWNNFAFNVISTLESTTIFVSSCQ